MKFSQAEKMDIFWWIKNIEDSFSQMQIPNCSFLLKTDASESSWGAFLIKKAEGNTLH